MNKQMLKEYMDACELVRETEEDIAENRCLKEQILKERKTAAESLMLEVDTWINTIPLRMQRIIRYRFFLGHTWKDTADYIKGKATENGLKKEFERFMETQ